MDILTTAIVIGLSKIWVPPVKEMDPYLSFEHFAFSEPISVQAIAGEWNDSIGSGDRAYYFHRKELGVRNQTFSVSHIERSDSYITFTNQTVGLFNDIYNQNLIPAQPVQPIQLDADILVTEGIKFDYKFTLTTNLKVTPAITVITGTKLVKGELWGNAWGTSDGSAHLDFDLDYIYSRDVLFGREAAQPESWGYAVDLAVEWRPMASTIVNLQIYDLIGVLYWRDALTTVATGAYDEDRLDADGNRIPPYTVILRDDYSNLGQVLSAKTFIDGRWSINRKYYLQASLQSYPVQSFFSIGLGVNHNHHTATSFLYDLENRVATFGVKYRTFNLNFASDNIRLGKANILSLKSAVTLHF